MAEWQKVFEDINLYRAEIVKDILSDKGLKSVIVNKKDAAYQMGNFEVHVFHDDVLIALKIINEEIKFE